MTEEEDEEEEEDDDEKIGKSRVRKNSSSEDTYKPKRHCLRYRWACGS